MGAIWMMVALIVLMGLDIGNLFWQKRELQKIADMAALAGVQGTSAGCATVRSYAQSNAQLNGLRSSGLNADTFLPADCGNWDPRLPPVVESGVNCNPACYFDKSRTPVNAVRVTVSRTVPYFFVFNWGSDGRLMKATATAAGTSSRAALNIRSTLVTVDSSKSTLLNAVFGGLLGGSLNLGVVGWQGLVNTNLNLLSYLDKLAVNLGAAAGDYNTLLDTNASAGALLQAAIDVLQRDGGTAAVDAITALIALQAAVPSSAPLLKLKDILQVQTGTPAAGLDLDLQAFQLAQGLVQLANQKNAVLAAVSLPVPGIGSVTVNLKVIEPPQLSAIGNPELAKSDPTGPNAIFVRTAQVRTLLSVNLNSPLTSLATTLSAAVGNIVSPITNLLNSVLTLNLVDVLSNLLCLGCTRNVTDIIVLPAPFRFDVNLELAAGKAYVSDFSCNSSTNKSLTVPASTAALEVRIGSMGILPADAVNNAFASNSAPTVAPVPLIDIGVKSCTVTCVAGICLPAVCQPRQPFAGGGLGLMADAPLAASSQVLQYSAPPATALPEIAEAPAYQSISSSNIVNSLSTTLSGVSIQAYKPKISGSGLGNVLSGAGTIIDTVVGLLQTAVSTVLSPLLDPIVNSLLQTLGIDLAQTSVGARLSCQQGAELVY